MSAFEACTDGGGISTAPLTEGGTSGALGVSGFTAHLSSAGGEERAAVPSGVASGPVLEVMLLETVMGFLAPPAWTFTVTDLDVSSFSLSLELRLKEIRPLRL